MRSIPGIDPLRPSSVSALRRIVRCCALGPATWARVLGLTVEDRPRLGALESPVAVCDLGLKLTRCPAGVADEDPQTVHGLVAAEQLEQQLPVRAQVDAVTSLDRMLGRRGGAKQEPHGPE